MSGSGNPFGSPYGSTMSGGVNYGDGSERREAGAARAPSGPEPTRDISTAEFMTEVIEASNTRPVLVDFWAPWCGPCRQLGPAIESAVRKANGKVRLVKMNIDEHPEVAGQMGIQSIPAVVAFDKGRPKDAFMGASPESEIIRFIEKLVGPSGPSELELALSEAARLLQEGAADRSAELYEAILGQFPDNKDARAGAGMAHLALGDIDRAREIAEGIAQGESHAGLKALVAEISLREKAGGLAELAELEARLASNPADHQVRFDLAHALNASGRREEAAEHLLHIIAKDRKWQDDGARQELLKFFEAWGPTDPATLAARRRLSSVLFS